jgi:two-component sensor histidine kinase
VEKNEKIEYQILMKRESDDRLLNDMQLVVSLLSMQGRSSRNAENTPQLVIAASRASTIARIHQRL